MKKFVFKPEKLLRYKEQVLEGELSTLAALNGELRKTEERIAFLETERHGSRAALEAEQMAGGVTPTRCQTVFSYENFLKAEAARERRMAERIAVRIEKQKDVIRELRLEIKSLEILKDAKWDEYMKAVRKEEEGLIDEFVNTMRVMRASF